MVGANGFGIGQPGATKPKPSRNETSILALLYWPNQDFCSYYTGGDGHPEVFKGAVQTWFRGFWSDDEVEVEMVKLDHHGSTRENLGEVHHKKGKGKSKYKEDEVPSESDSESEADMEEEEEERPMTDPEPIGLVVQYMRPKRVLVTPGSRHGHPSKPPLLPVDENAHDETNGEVFLLQLGTF